MPVGRDGAKLLSWRVAILPQMGYQSLYDRFHLDEPWDSPRNRSLLAEMPRQFACPGGSGQRAGKTGYLVIVGPETDAYSTNTPFEPTRGADIRHITDGTSQTILVFETDVMIPWTKPDDLQWVKGGPLPRVASPHAGARTWSSPTGPHDSSSPRSIPIPSWRFSPSTAARLLRAGGDNAGKCRACPGSDTLENLEQIEPSQQPCDSACVQCVICDAVHMQPCHL